MLTLARVTSRGTPLPIHTSRSLKLVVELILEDQTRSPTLVLPVTTSGSSSSDSRSGWKQGKEVSKDEELVSLLRIVKYSNQNCFL